MPQDLPYELEELILSYILHDPVSLKSCSLVCRRFSNFVQRHLFENISLSFSNQSKSDTLPARFVRLLISSPHLATLVQSISIIETRNRIGYPTHLRDDILLPACLPLLKNLRSIGFHSNSFSSPSWKAFSPETQKAILNAFRLPSLVSISLYRIIDIPISLLSGCVALEELSLKFVTFQDEDIQEWIDQDPVPLIPIGSNQRMKLKSLLLSLADPVFHFFTNWLLSPSCALDLSNLQRLSVSMTMEYHDHGNIGKLLQASATTLEVLCFSPSFGGPTRLTLNPINLDCLPRLRVLRLRLGMARGPSGQSFLPWILEAIKQLNSKHIEEISIKSNLFKELQAESSIDMSAWSALDSTLSSFASLRLATLFVLKDETILTPELLAEIRNNFPNLSGQGILNIEPALARVGFGASDSDSL
ncbi:hypothetical protein GALMADRAFT_246763 [Galerina marginata CBS 339.88]|uniref:F-box domain-containing protein n=1 Tax=Galerina marginata (strain CBS 339.88) TaxID=685588 RepID=A0A067TBR6_GALM3|nr:hypothetical protein GALMADRAFT_246763 [Galerina marginata CBS 339.88]